MSSEVGCVGKVYLVGAGPGDPDLITLKGIECLRKADFVLYDGLVNPLILLHTHADAIRTARADVAGKRVLNQSEINARLIEEALAGKTVVRLKGGDPFIFGRGAEEAAALAEQGIPFEVVPGITAATAAAEYAGISLTHRDYASAVCLVTGHEDPTKPESALNYQNLAQFPGTLVFYMGLHRCSEIVQSLLDAGMPEETMGAVITKASTPLQKTISDTIKNLPARIREAKLEAPSLIVVGNCVQQREQIKWFEEKPLLGLQIGITRAKDQAAPQIRQALELGASPVLMPMLEIEMCEHSPELLQAVKQISRYEWILFTSSNAVHAVMKAILDSEGDLRLLSECQLACIGTATTKALSEYFLKPDLVSKEHSSERLAESLLEFNPTGPIFWPRANRGRDVLEKRFAEKQIPLEQVVVYEHHDCTELSAQTVHLIETKSLNWVALSSPAIAKTFARLIQQRFPSELTNHIRFVAISPLTAKAGKEAGLNVELIAKETTWEGIFQAILENHSK